MSLNIPLIRESFSAIKPHAKEVVEHFYDELFTKHPEAKKLFKGVKMEKQHVGLANALAHAVEYLGDLDHLSDYFFKMGERHFAYGTRPEHFGPVAEALLATFRYYFDKEWTPELEAQWTAVLTFAAGAMQKGMAKAQAEKAAQKEKDVDLETVARTYAQDLLRKTLEDEIQNGLTPLAREKVRELLKKCVELEVKELLQGSRRKAA